MKRIFLGISFVAAVAVGLSSCDKKDDATPVPTFDSYLQANSNLSMFSQALDKAQLQGFKNGQGPFTWFVPTNDAFVAAGVTADSLNKMTASQASYLLLYSVINPTSIPLVPVYTTDMVAQNSFAKSTQLGQNIYLGKYADSFYVNGGAIVSKDVAVSNGIVHVVNQLAVPPNLKSTVGNILSTSGQHTLFIQALTKANRYAALNTTSVYTVYAPTDAAMTAAGFTSTAITAATTGRIDSLVRYHMFSGPRLFTNDLGNGNTPATMLSATSRLVSSAFGRKVKGATNSAPIDVTKANQLGTNGVVHFLNGVLSY